MPRPWQIPLLLIACLSTGNIPAAEPQTLSLLHPNGLAIDREGNLYISDIGAHCIFKLTRDQKLTRIAGTGRPGFAGDGGLATNARLNAPMDLAFDDQGNLLIADTYNHRIRRIDQGGVISTIAGDGGSKYSTIFKGPASRTSLNNPQGIALDRDGNLYIADTYNHIIRRVDPQGQISTFAGSEPGLAAATS